MGSEMCIRDRMMAVILAAGFMQAASVGWSTGQLKAPNPDGTFSATSLGSSTAYTAVTFFFVDNSGVAGAAVTGLTNTSDPSAGLSAYGLTTGGTAFSANAKYWTYVVVTANDNSFSLTSSTASFTVPGTGNATLNYQTGAGFDTVANKLPGQWTVVPEPTSMALLALGAAAMGLRRKFRK